MIGTIILYACLLSLGIGVCFVSEVLGSETKQKANSQEASDRLFLAGAELIRLKHPKIFNENVEHNNYSVTQPNESCHSCGSPLGRTAVKCDYCGRDL